MARELGCLGELQGYSAAELRALIGAASDAYYNDVALISDEVFDVMVDRLQVIEPGSTLDIGAPPRSGEPEQMPAVWMGSLAKVKDAASVERFVATGKMHVTAKLDGMSCLYVVATGQLFTRGAGKGGWDMSCLREALQLPPPGRRPGVLAVRGELVVPRTEFEALGIVGSSRQQMGGKLRRLDVAYAAHVRFVAFELVSTGTNVAPSEQRRQLAAMGFLTPESYGGAVTAPELKRWFMSLRQDSLFEVDGVVLAKDEPYERVTSGISHHALAFKCDVADQQRTTTVTGIEWDASRYGVLTPVLVLVPVLIAGNVCSRCTASNAAALHRLGLGPGAVIVVKRSGDVSPQLHRVVTKSTHTDVMPSVPAVWDGQALRVKDPDSDARVQVRRMSAFFKDLGIDRLRDGLMKRLHDAGLHTIQDLCTASKTTLLAIDGVGPSGAEHLMASLEGVTGGSFDMVNLMQASSCTEHFGIRRLRDIAAALTIETCTAADIAALPGFGAKLAAQFIASRDKFNTWKTMNPAVKVPAQAVAKRAAQLRPIVLSGFRDKALEAKFGDAGFVQRTSVSRTTEFLVVGNKTGKKASSKEKRAAELGIPVISRSDLESMIARK